MRAHARMTPSTNECSMQLRAGDDISTFLHLLDDILCGWACFALLLAALLLALALVTFAGSAAIIAIALVTFVAATAVRALRLFSTYTNARTSESALYDDNHGAALLPPETPALSCMARNQRYHHCETRRHYLPGMRRLENRARRSSSSESESSLLLSAPPLFPSAPLRLIQSRRLNMAANPRTPDVQA